MTPHSRGSRYIEERKCSKSNCKDRKETHEASATLHQGNKPQGPEGRKRKGKVRPGFEELSMNEWIYEWMNECTKQLRFAAEPERSKSLMRKTDI